MRQLLVRVHGIDGGDWNRFAANYGSFLQDLIERYDATLELRLKVLPSRDQQFMLKHIPEDHVDGWFEFQPRDSERADHMARELADRFRRVGGPMASALVSVCVVRFRVHHSYGG